MDTLLRVRTLRRRGIQRIRRARGHSEVRGTREGPGDADRVQPGEHEPLHRLEQEHTVRGHPRRRGVRDLMALANPHTIEDASAEEVIAYAVERFHPRLTMACSFQKEESVLVHMLMEICPDARVFTIDTGVLFPETLATWKQFEDRFGVSIEVFDASSPGRPWTLERCCGPSKVEALERALEGAEAWVTGIRREQAPTRAAAPKLDYDEPR